MPRTRIRRMSINQHVIFGNELKEIRSSVSEMLTGTDYSGVVPKKVSRKLAKINSYLSQIMNEMDGIVSRQHPEMEASLLGGLYSNSSGAKTSGERQG